MSFLNGQVPTDELTVAMTHEGHRSLYQPYYVDGPYDKHYATTIFPRDPRTGIQVWSGDSGYPGDGVYLDFHKKRWPGGHRYWRVTGPRIDLGDKQPYDPREAAERVKSHASHFVHLVYEALKPGFEDSIPRSCALRSTPSSSATGGLKERCGLRPSLAFCTTMTPASR